MPDIYLRFAVAISDPPPPAQQRLEVTSSDPGTPFILDFTATGPLFTQYLPNGRADAIILADTESLRLAVWFERHGVREGPFIRYQPGKQIQDDTAELQKQAILDAGILHGEAVLPERTDDELASLSEPNLGNQLYLRLAKRFFRLSHPRLASFIHILRMRYGQYWLRAPERYDSKKKSLGALSADYRLAWATSDEGPFQTFSPDKPRLTIRFSAPLFPPSTYLSSGDWQQLRADSDTQLSPFTSQSAGHALLLSAFSLLERNQVRHAIIETVSALDIAIDAYIRRVIAPLFGHPNAIEGLFTLPLPQRFALTVGGVRDPIRKSIQKVLKVVDARNKVVHEGRDPIDTEFYDVYEAQMVVGSILDPVIYRLCPRNPGWNQIGPPFVAPGSFSFRAEADPTLKGQQGS